MHFTCGQLGGGKWEWENVGGGETFCCGEGFSITFINFPSQNGAASENE